MEEGEHIRQDRNMPETWSFVSWLAVFLMCQDHSGTSGPRIPGALGSLLKDPVPVGGEEDPAVVSGSPSGNSLWG